VLQYQPYAPTAFTPGEILGTYFQGLSRPQATWFRREPRKKSPVTPPGIDPGTVRALTTTLHQAPGFTLLTESYGECNCSSVFAHFIQQGTKDLFPQVHQA
jgi:hypothetical protein